MTRPVVVLGGSGFLGRHICAAFAASGAQVVRVARTIRDDDLDGDGLRSVSLDLTRADPRRIARLLADTGAQVIVNASGAVWDCTEQQMTELNALLVSRLLEAIDELTGRPRLIQLGSAYEYGPAPAGAAVGEDWPPAPTSAYGRTKLVGTQAVLRAAADNGLDGMVLRVSVACGSGTPRASLSGIVAAHLVEGRPEVRLAPLRAYRDVVDVRDVADAVVAAARAPAGTGAGTVLNIGRGEAVHVRRLVELMISVSGQQMRVVEDPDARRLRAEAEWQRLDISRARRMLGWSPSRRLEDSLRDALSTFRELGPDGGPTTV